MSTAPRMARRLGRQSLLVFGAPLIGEEEIAEVVDTLRSGWIGFGPKCIQLEHEFASYVQARRAVSLNSCTAGLHLALLATGVGRGDEVITTPLTFSATANVIEHVAATPVFADVEPRSQNLDPARVEAAVTSRTKAIIPVHMAGRPCDMDAIGDIARRHGLAVIEDAAHAAEASWRGRKVGSISRFTAFSFYATKNMTTGEGGMLTTDDDEVADRLQVLRLHGLTKDAWERYGRGGFRAYETVEPGFKYNMTDIQASLGIHQLARLERNLKVREDIWSFYDESFAGLEAIETPAPPALGERHARHLYTIQLRDEALRIDRAQFLDEMTQRNIGTGIHFVPVHLHPYYQRTYGLREGTFPVAEEIGRRTVSLPLSAGMSLNDAEDVVDAVSSIVGAHGR